MIKSLLVLVAATSMVGNALELKVTAPDRIVEFGQNKYKTRCENMNHAYDLAIEYYQKKIDNLGKDKTLSKASREQLSDLHFYLANTYLYKEETLYKAIKELEKSYSLTQDIERGKRSLKLLAGSQLRLGEIKNCVKYHNQDSCIWPLSENARHKDKYGSKAALKNLEKYLTKYGHDNEIVFAINLAHQTLGTYPEKVKTKYLLPLENYKSKIKFPRFLDIAQPLGLQKYNLQAGAATLVDFNLDGNMDLFFSSRAHCDNVRYFENDGKGNFIEKGKDIGIDKIQDAVNIQVVDYNNDGHQDLYLARGGWDIDLYSFPKIGRQTNLLLENNGKGKLKDVTKKVGLDLELHHHIGTKWIDFDLNGTLDLFVCNEMKYPALFLNKKNKFVNILKGQEKWKKSEQVGTDKARCKGVAIEDIDNDGDLDIYLSYHGSDNLLYENRNGKLILHKKWKKLTKPFMSFIPWIFDYDQDGYKDIIALSFETKYGVEYFSHKKNNKFKGETLRVYRNLKGKDFVDVTKDLGLAMPILSMGANYGDINNDGYIDFFLGTGGAGFINVEPNRMFLNLRGQKYEDVTIAGGFGNIQKGHGIAFGDIDNDGDQDVLAQYGGAFPGDKFFLSLYHNPIEENNWIKLRLKGVKSNSLGLGAKIHIQIEENKKIRNIYRTLSHGGNFGTNPNHFELGLGKASIIKNMSVYFPHKSLQGKPQVFKDVKVNKYYELKEGGHLKILKDSKKIEMNINKNGEHCH